MADLTGTASSGYISYMTDKYGGVCCNGKSADAGVVKTKNGGVDDNCIFNMIGYQMCTIYTGKSA